MTTASGKRIGSRMNTRREEEEEEEEEALDLFVPDGEFIDPEVLSALPPSVRLEVIGKMRDKRMADNREHFAAASGKMQDFSALQLQTYLKGTKIKRQIDEVMQRADVDDPMTETRRRQRQQRFHLRRSVVQRRSSARDRSSRVTRAVGRVESQDWSVRGESIRDGAFGSARFSDARRAPGTILGDQSPPDAADAVRREVRRRDTDHA